MKAYYFLSRLFSPAITAAFYLYSLLMRTPRARVVARNEDGEVLLVRSWPDTSVWNLPGGGVKRKERPEQAAARELCEETGIIVQVDEMEPRLTLRSQGHTELVFAAGVTKDRLPEVLPNRWEVRQAEWFMPDALPRTTPVASRIIAEVAARR